MSAVIDMDNRAFLIAAPQSGSGKTTVSLAVMAAFSRRGVAVAPFKCGPDFIDPGYHALVTGRPSLNLDAWMCPEWFVGETFRLHSAGADLAVIEGVMGLFDGLGSEAMVGSSAQIAALTGAPVVLVVNARGMAASVAALVAGFACFEPSVRIAGVIFNNVGSTSHAALLREALAVHCPGTACFGAIPRDEQLAIPSRHLGLVTAEDNPLGGEFLSRLADMAERCLDLDALAALATDGGAGRIPRPARLTGGEAGPGTVRIAVARDAAFCFCYPDNLRLLAEAGAELCFFSPLGDPALPEEVQGIYLPGGYPELFAGQLGGNTGMLQAIRAAVAADIPVYAECGGLIYLTEGLEQGADFAGIFPLRARMLPRRKALGYRQAELLEDCLLGRQGTVVRGHEFHYSELGEMPATVERVYRVSRRGELLGLEGYRTGSCLASYLHLHFGSNPGLASAFVQACKSRGPMLQN